MVRCKRAMIIVMIVVAFLASLMLIASKLTDRTGATAIQRMNPPDLEKEVRRALPVGSSLEIVEAYVTKLGMKSSYDSRSKTVFAIVRDIKGSGMIVRRDFEFTFVFDDASLLKSIDAKEELTGP
jgi:hypothetical protein